MRERWRGYVWVLLVSVAIAVGAPDARAFAHGPDWTIGRAVIVTTPRGGRTPHGLYLKLSLRNVGTPGRTPVRIFGRWALEEAADRNTRGAGSPIGPGWAGPARTDNQHGSSPTGRWSVPNAPSYSQAPSAPGIRAGGAQRRQLPRGMRLLGSYRREVSLNQTTILAVPLTTLGTPRRDIHRLEVVVMTAAVVTDHQFVELAANRRAGY